jgi:hypothetical protein
MKSSKQTPSAAPVLRSLEAWEALLLSSKKKRSKERTEAKLQSMRIRPSFSRPEEAPSKDYAQAQFH